MRFDVLLRLASAQAVLLGFAAASPAGVPRGRLGARQDSAVPTAEENERAAQIKDIFTTAWEGYYTYAFPNDELRPLNRTFVSNYNGWGLTVVDALSTASIMGLQSIVDRSLEFIPTIDYTHDSTNRKCSLFETNIRHLAGLLSAHDLLTGPLAHLVKNETQAAALLPQARLLADTLKFGFDTPTGIPSNGLYINNRSTDGATDNNIAQVGTLVLEWTRLSDLTGEPEYGELAQKGQDWLVSPRGKFGEPYPGLIGIEINITTGRFTSEEGGWVGGVDSFYEYLIKMFVYDPTRFEFYKDRWVTAVESSIKYLESHPSSRPDLTFLAFHNGSRIVGYSEHLACFDGGNFILGGLVLEEQRYIDFGLKLVDGCEAIYNETLTGLGPDVFRWDPLSNTNQTNGGTPIPANQTAFYARAGFWIDAAGGGSGYGLGPEALESFYYAYRATGDRKYQDYIWHAVRNLREFSTVAGDVGFSTLKDVNAAGGGGFANYQPSFFLAETLKYAFLAHAPQEGVQVGGGWTAGAQEWVFNTEAHPMKVVR
ncbi:glycoside hydrolase family 47 protein [Diplodia corticola]|uniref:alpha-1,2-Mannosidase n=1 Tax=Diplodia corticola TaxID=236234 RepID=A0A1J9S5D3_9PEZI|nr:glycoside hydrolase family 47 protein [Diplodia corticola]OJD34829.1 glycoside hydrolase family 47 protein [Diplodia corticola]